MKRHYFLIITRPAQTSYGHAHSQVTRAGRKNGTPVVIDESPPEVRRALTGVFT